MARCSTPPEATASWPIASSSRTAGPCTGTGMVTARGLRRSDPAARKVVRCSLAPRVGVLQSGAPGWRTGTHVLPFLVDSLTVQVRSDRTCTGCQSCGHRHKPGVHFSGMHAIHALCCCHMHACVRCRALPHEAAGPCWTPRMR